MTNPKTEPRAAAGNRVKMRFPLGLVTAGDPSQQPGQRSGVNGPCPPRSAGGVAPEGIPLVGAWRSQAPMVNGPKSVVQTRSWPRGTASAGGRRSGSLPGADTGWSRDWRRSVGGRCIASLTGDGTTDALQG